MIYADTVWVMNQMRNMEVEISLSTFRGLGRVTIPSAVRQFKHRSRDSAALTIPSHQLAPIVPGAHESIHNITDDVTRVTRDMSRRVTRVSRTVSHSHMGPDAALVEILHWQAHGELLGHGIEPLAVLTGPGPGGVDGVALVGVEAALGRVGVGVVWVGQAGVVGVIKALVVGIVTIIWPEHVICTLNNSWWLKRFWENSPFTFQRCYKQHCCKTDVSAPAEEARWWGGPAGTWCSLRDTPPSCRSRPDPRSLSRRTECWPWWPRCWSWTPGRGRGRSPS